VTAPAGAAALRIGGLERFSSVDYPGALAAVVFCQGCALRCVYCHNRDLLDPQAARSLSFADVAAHLDRRRGLLDAVVFSGGEPLLQRGLEAAAAEVKARGLKVGLHTSGAAPARLRRMLALTDWIGLDLKAPFDDYGALTGVAGAGAKARDALDLLAAANIPFEARTTVWPARHSVEALVALAGAAREAGAERFVLQQARDPQSRRPVPSPLFADPDHAAPIRRAHPNLVLRAA